MYDGKVVADGDGDADDDGDSDSKQEVKTRDSVSQEV